MSSFPLISNHGRLTPFLQSGMTWTTPRIIAALEQRIAAAQREQETEAP